MESGEGLKKLVSGRWLDTQVGVVHLVLICGHEG